MLAIVSQCEKKTVENGALFYGETLIRFINLPFMLSKFMSTNIGFQQTSGAHGLTVFLNVID